MYTPHQVAQLLRDTELEIEDFDLSLDLPLAVEKLEEPGRSLILLYREGVSPSEAVVRLKLKDNPHRLYTRALRALVGILNGTEV